MKIKTFSKSLVSNFALKNIKDKIIIQHNLMNLNKYNYSVKVSPFTKYILSNQNNSEIEIYRFT